MVNSEIIMQNNPFEELILVESIPEGKDIYLMTQGQKFLKCSDYQWVGSLEAVAFMRSFRTGTLTKKKIEEEKYILGD